jgi:hypothetical protein
LLITVLVQAASDTDETTFSAPILVGAAAVAALYGLTRVAESAAEPITATDPL